MMKNLITIILTMLCLNSFAQDMIKSADLIREDLWKMDKEFGSIYDGSITIDRSNFFTRGSITLEYQNAPYCPPGMACIAALIPQKIELPIVEIKTDSCGNINFKAMMDETPVDGIRQTLNVNIMTYNTCLGVIPTNIPTTRIHYKKEFYDRMKGKLIERNAYLFSDVIR